MTTPSLFRRRMQLAGLLSGLLAASLLLASCQNPFTPATPETPDGDCIAEEYGTPDELLNTMALAIATRSPCGANAWTHAFAESTSASDRAFRAFYDPAVKASWQATTQQTAPEPWGLALESKMHTKISGIISTYVYVWQWLPDAGSGLDEFPADADTGLMHRRYKLFATDATGTQTLEIAAGYADLAVQKKGGRWSVFRWNDRLDPDVGLVPANQLAYSMSFRRLESVSRTQGVSQ